jgi:hypothetical protein
VSYQKRYSPKKWLVVRRKGMVLSVLLPESVSELGRKLRKRDFVFVADFMMHLEMGNAL